MLGGFPGKYLDVAAIGEVAGGENRHDQKKWGSGGIINPHGSRTAGLAVEDG